MDARCQKDFSVYETNFPDVKFIYPGKSGVSALRNFGMTQVKTEFFSFLDDDDFWFPDFAEKQIQNFETGIGISASSALFCSAFGVTKRPKSLMNVKSNRDLLHRIYKRSFLPSRYYLPIGAIVFRSEQVAQISFNESLTIREDLEFLSKIAHLGIVQTSDLGVVIISNRQRAWERENFKSAYAWACFLNSVDKHLGLRFLIIEYMRTSILRVVLRLKLRKINE